MRISLRSKRWGAKVSCFGLLSTDSTLRAVMLIILLRQVSGRFERKSIRP